MRKFLAIVALAVVATAGACGWLAVDRPVRVVKVEGELTESEANQIRRRIGRVLESRLLTMDVGALRERVKGLSWPGEVSVRKVWPDTVLVRVSRRSVVARWAEAGYLTPTGEIVSTPNDPVRVPVFDCALSSPEEAMEIYRYLQGTSTEVGLVIRQLSENEIGEWQIAFARPRDRRTATLEDGMAGPVVMLGADSLGERMQRFLVAWSRLLERRAGEIDYVDLRYGNGLAVRWRASDTGHAHATGTTGATGTT